MVLSGDIEGANSSKTEVKNFNILEEFNGAEVRIFSVFEGNNALIVVRWVFDITLKGKTRTKIRRIMIQEWKDDKIVDEKFYYNLRFV